MQQPAGALGGPCRVVIVGGGRRVPGKEPAEFQVVRRPAGGCRFVTVGTWRRFDGCTAVASAAADSARTRRPPTRRLTGRSAAHG
ncbi:MAG: hypothetical protein ACRDOK_08885 [Streptosporangiaceae bacterium]